MAKKKARARKKKTAKRRATRKRKAAPKKRAAKSRRAGGRARAKTRRRPARTAPAPAAPSTREAVGVSQPAVEPGLFRPTESGS